MAITATNISVASPQVTAQGGSSLAAQGTVTLSISGDGASTSFTQSLASLGLIGQSFGLPISGTATLVKQQNSGTPGAWARGKAYALNAFIGAANGTLQKATTAGTSLNASWQASTAFSINQIVIDSNGNGQQVTTAGTSGTVTPVNFVLNEPSGTVTNDGTVIWKNLGPYPNFSSTIGATFTDGTVIWTGQGPNTAANGYDAPTATVTITGGNLVLTFSEALKAPGAQITDTYGNVFTYAAWSCIVTLTYGSGSSGNTTATWNSSTTVNTTLQLPLAGAPTVLVPILDSGTVTGGVLGFQASIDGSNWFTLFGTIPGNFQPIGGWNLTSGNTAITFNVAGYNFFQVILTSVVLGTGSVTVAIQSQSVSNANIVIVGPAGSYSTSAPAPSSGNVAPLQIAPNGSLLVQPYRRSQIVMASGSIASTTAATLLAAQGAGVFADLKSLVLTLSAESTAAYITVTISDGTTNYVFGYPCEPVGTAGAGSWPIAMDWSVPIPATNANTAWTIVLSAADATIRYVAQFVKQTANF